MKKTKIICTIGPAVDNEESLYNLMINGMDCARFNFSHGTHESQKVMMDLVKNTRKKVNKPVSILLDTKGPEIRVKDFKNGYAMLENNQLFTFDTDEKTLGDKTRIGLTYHDLAKTLKVGTKILVDDGKISMTLEEIKGDSLICRVINGGKISNHKSLNIPNVEIPMEYLSEVDKSDILFGIQENVDFIAASFVRCKEDILQLRKFLKENGGEGIEIISKIENIQGVKNLDEIIKVSDGIMVARGDLGVEIPFKDIPALQKEMIYKCNKEGKLVVVATQMLESMTKSPRPTRAEVSDVANAIFDGADIIMLSGESASGDYPIEAVRTMSEIATSAEESLERTNINELNHDFGIGISETVCKAAHEASEYISSKAIVVVTRSGKTAKEIAKFKPNSKIISVTLNERAKNQLSLYYNTYSVMAEEKKSFEQLIEYAKEKALSTNLVNKGDVVVIVVGSLQKKGYSDTLRICEL